MFLQHRKLIWLLLWRNRIKVEIEMKIKKEYISTSLITSLSLISGYCFDIGNHLFRTGKWPSWNHEYQWCSVSPNYQYDLRQHVCRRQCNFLMIFFTIFFLKYFSFFRFLLWNCLYFWENISMACIGQTSTFYVSRLPNSHFLSSHLSFLTPFIIGWLEWMKTLIDFLLVVPFY